MTQFVAKLNKLLVTPAKDDAGHCRDVRFQLDAPDPIDAQTLLELVGIDVVVTLEPAPLPLLPMEEAIQHTRNGRR